MVSVNKQEKWSRRETAIHPEKHEETGRVTKGAGGRVQPTESRIQLTPLTSEHFCERRALSPSVFTGTFCPRAKQWMDMEKEGDGTQFAARNHA